MAINLTTAKQLLSLNGSFTEKELKAAFRQKSKEHHPDVGGTAERFNGIKDAYDLLKDFCFSPDEMNIISQEVTVEGIALSDLGHGLGPLTNGTSCNTCNGSGYTTTFGHRYTICNHCDDYGLVFRKASCRPCNGTGKFQQARSKKVVDCRVCKGSGIFFNYKTRKIFCSVCGGSKTLWTDNKQSPMYHKCSTCDGAGETLVMNPVIPKGALVA